MIEGGYILQPRTIDDSEVAKFPPVTRELWHYLLRKVNHARNDRLNINRGQGFFNLTDIQDDLKWYAGYRKNVYSKPQLTKSLQRLREGSMIVTTKETRGVLITICKYDYYQDSKNYEGNDEGNAKETRRKRTGRTIKKNVKNEKNEKNDNKKDFMSDSVEIRLANLLFSKILSRNPEHKKPDFQKWAKQFDSIVRIDKRDPQKIANMIEWISKDNGNGNGKWKGWSAVVLSPNSIRDNHDKIAIQMGGDSANPESSFCDKCATGMGSCPWRTDTNKPPVGKKCFSPITGRN